MLNLEFYKKIDTELLEIITGNPSDKIINLHPKKEANKPQAFLVWFLNFYGQTRAHARYITEGKGDNSCDIILDINDVEKGKVFYVVQAKWNGVKKIEGKIDATEFKASLEDFKLILNGNNRTTDNASFNKKYAQLRKHLDNNGEVKFIFLSLSNYNDEVEENIKDFKRNYQTSIEVLDINRIKRDYIDFKYKRIIPSNPLENAYIPNEEIKLDIEQLDIKKNYLKIDKPFDAYIFLVRPKTIYQLFEKYKFKLFFKNVRNPLISSKVNLNIEETLRSEVPYFWYFNNGITALTSEVINERINPTAKSIKVSGLQVINGAQTVYSIYKSYKEASEKERRVINKQALITLRLLTINSEELSLKITKFTNSQNPMEERDFWANDDTQIELQQQSFHTNYWYEKRRGEFRAVPEGIEVVSNKFFAVYHLAFNLQKPTLAKKAMFPNAKDLIFTSRKDDKDALYEVVFLDNPIRFDNMLAAFLLSEKTRFLIPNRKEFGGILSSNFLENLCLSKILLTKYLKWKFKSELVNISKYIINHIDKNDVFIKIALQTNTITYDFLGMQAISSPYLLGHVKYQDFLTIPSKFELVKEYFEDLEFTDELGEKIEAIQISQDES